jgi:hypothetical protein
VLLRSRRYGSREGIAPQSTLVALIFHVAAVRTTMALGNLVRAIYTAAQSRLCVPPTAYHARQRGVGCTSQEESREERGGRRNEYGAGIDGRQEWWRRSYDERSGKPGCLRAGTILFCADTNDPAVDARYAAGFPCSAPHARMLEACVE